MSRDVLSWTISFARTAHGFVVLMGLLVGLLYFPAWFGYLFSRALDGAVSWFLIATMLMFISLDLWQNRAVLKECPASEEDKLIGHALIISGVLVYPFCRFALWPQALVWLLVLTGILISSWGLSSVRATAGSERRHSKLYSPLSLLVKVDPTTVNTQKLVQCFLTQLL